MGGWGPDRGLQGLSALTASNTLRVSCSVLPLCVSSCAHNMIIVFISSAHSEQQQQQKKRKRNYFSHSLTHSLHLLAMRQHCRRGGPSLTHIRRLEEINGLMFSRESDLNPFLRASRKPAFCCRKSSPGSVTLILWEAELALATLRV